MRAPSGRRSFSMRAAVALLVGAVLVPTALSISVGIVALALWDKAVDIVLGVLVISFAAMVLGGAVGTLVLLAKWNRLARLQADFMANISHDVKTPLTAIRMLAETLRFGRAESAEDVRACLDALMAETERLARYIERILHWRGMEAGAGGALRRVERLEEIVGDALRPLEAANLARPTKIELVAESGLPAVLADRRAVAEAVQNVVDNALLYGDRETPVKIRLYAAEDRRTVAVEVLDHGPGIARHEHKRIFDRFYRGEQARNDAARGGTGLGLSIARHVVEAHAGTIELESHVGWGTRVTLRLPAAPLDPGGEPRRAAQEEGGASVTARLLLAEGPLPAAEEAPAPAADAPGEPARSGR